MLPELTQNVLDFLGNPASYAHHPAQVTLHQTHASWVFVASPYVYKIKKPVNFGFMDFTTLEQRKANCDREVTLNRRLTEDIYLDVEAVTMCDGQLRFGAEGEGPSEVVEWAVKMRELDPRDFLSHRIRDKRFELSDLDRVIDRLVEFYRHQPPLDAAKAQAAVAQMPKNIANNYKIARRFIPDCTSKVTIDLIEHFTQSFETSQAELLASRSKSGMIRDCHGDLHLEHIHVTPKAINIYDCIEFNTEFREIDVACDIAFLAMDLDFAGSDYSAYLVRRAAELLADEGIASLADYYKCYRASVRGKVESLSSSGDGLSQKEQAICRRQARRYFQLALRYAIVGSKPIAFVCMGQAGAGKSTLARELARVTGWSRLSSDRYRKNLAGVSTTKRGTADERAALYSNEMSSRVYALMLNNTIGTLRGGRPIILDATYSRRSERDVLSGSVVSLGYKVIWIEAFASPEIRKQRLKAREFEQGVISDAREEDFETLSNRYQPPDEVPCGDLFQIDTSIDLQVAFNALVSRLMEHRLSQIAKNPSGSFAF